MKFNDYLFIRCTSPLPNDIMIKIDNTNLLYIKSAFYENSLVLTKKNKKNIYTPIRYQNIVTIYTKEELFEQLNLTYEYIKLKYMS